MKPSAQSLVLLEFNEVNFDFVRRYIERGHLKTIAALLESSGLAETTSEETYEHLEPWIQWVTAHTGLPYSEHRIYRLGDAADTQLNQIWESLESAGLTVGAISPMNAANRTRQSPFFVPDPWTRTSISGGWVLRQLWTALAQAVGENAQRRISLQSLIRLALAWTKHARSSTLGQLSRFALQRKANPWYASLFLDRFLADVFICQWRRARPDFSSLFLNAAAHIQHHYMFSSAVYDGPHRNPDWYITAGKDPLLDVYSLYDRILADVLRLPGAPRVMVATGLHQDPHPTQQFYYRLKDHDGFLRRLGLRFARVEALMSRDFTVYCASTVDAALCASELEQLTAPDGKSLFSVDNRGSDIFVMLTYPGEIQKDFIILRSQQPMWDLIQDVAFVALKNGEHNGIGYFSDTGAPQLSAGTRFPLADIFARICQATGVSSSKGSSNRLQAA